MLALKCLTKILQTMHNQNFKVILILTVFLILSFNSKAQDPNYNRFFTSNVMRIDLTHAGSSTQEYYFPAQFYQEKNWAGTYTNLIDTSGFGDNYFEVLDSASGEQIYSRGYNNLFYEWQLTAEAKLTTRSFEEVIRFPFPLKKVQVKIYRRLSDGDLLLLHSFFVDPESYRIVKEQKYQFKTEKLYGNLSPNKAVDVVFLAEGYTKKEMKQFKKEAQSLVDFMFKSKPFDQVQSQFNIWLVFSISQESGTDIPGEDIWKQTLFDSHFYTFGSERYLTSQSIKKIHDVASLAPYDQVYVLVNSEKYGGGGIFNYYNLTSTRNPLSPWVFIHEFGHGFAGLADEYFDGSTAFNDMYDLKHEPWRENISTLADIDKKWKDKVEKGVPIPTPSTNEYKDKVGFFEGGGYVAKGIYRPYQECEMKALQKGFCPICADAIIKMVNFNTDK